MIATRAEHRLRSFILSGKEEEHQVEVNLHVPSRRRCGDRRPPLSETSVLIKSAEAKLFSFPQSAPADRRAEAFTVCEQFVERRLKAPGTAKFSHVWDSTISGSGGGPYEIDGYVDAQNSFGALLRNRYSCSVEASSGKSWTLKSLSMQ